jgi:hypothetical protein
MFSKYNGYHHHNHRNQHYLLLLLLLTRAEEHIHCIVMVIFVILPIVLYEFKIWFLRFMAKHRLMVFEHRVLIRIFGPRRNDNRGLGKNA